MVERLSGRDSPLPRAAASAGASEVWFGARHVVQGSSLFFCDAALLEGRRDTAAAAANSERCYLSSRDSPQPRAASSACASEVWLTARLDV